MSEFAPLALCGILLVAVTALERANRQETFDTKSANVFPSPAYAQELLNKEIEQTLSNSKESDDVLNLCASSYNPYKNLQESLKEELNISSTFSVDPHFLCINLASFLQINSSFSSERELTKILIENGLILSPAEVNSGSPGSYKMVCTNINSQICSSILKKLKKVKKVIEEIKNKKRSYDKVQESDDKTENDESAGRKKSRK